jgi:hypothetical protein
VLGLAAGTIVTESAVTRVCPLNAVLGRDTRSQDDRLRDSRAELSVMTERAISVARLYAVADSAARLA